MTLRSSEVELVPLRESHSAALLAFIDAATWRGFLSPQPRTVEDVVAYVRRLIERSDGMAFAVLDAATGDVRGSTAFYEFVPDQGRVEIGYTFFGRQYRGGRTNRWCKLLMLEHAFTVWDVHRVAFRCDVRNARSIAAIERLGAVREGILRGHRVAADGLRSDTMVFSVLVGEWPAVRRELQLRVHAPGASGT